MRLQEEQQLAEEIRHAIPNITIPQPDVFDSTGRRRADSGAHGAPRKKARMGGREGDNARTRLVGVSMKISQLRLTSQQAVCSRW